MCCDRPFAETISLLADHALGLECAPAYTGSLHGTPHGARGIDPDTWRGKLAGTDLEELKERLSDIPFVTIHAAMSGKHCRMGSADAEKRRLAWERCEDAIRFGAAVGARLVTFHAVPGQGYYEDRPDYRSRFVEFGRRAAEVAAESGVMLAFEVFDYELIDEIDRENFRILFDIGHAAKLLPAGPDACTDHVMELLKEAGDRIVQFHVHGVRWTGQTLEDHMSLALNDCIDYARIVRFVKQQDIRAPWVFEMQVELASTEAVVAACVHGRRVLIDCWNEV